MKVCTTLALAALMLAVLGRISALEVSAGTLRLVLHQGIGRFSLYSDGVPLFVDQDPRTSGLAVTVDNKVYRLGETLEFRQKAEALPQGGRFTWTSPRLTLTESFSLAEPSSLVITITAANTGESDLRIGFRLFLDTCLGEEAYPHFQTDLQAEINGESTLLRTNMPRYWLSASFRSRKPAGLLCLLRGMEAREPITEPDRVVFANWKRMSEAGWSYETSPGRSFSDLPYSINDSAVFQYYDPKLVPRGGSRTATIVLRATKPSLPDLEPQTPQASATPVEAASPQAGETPGEAAGSAPVEKPSGASSAAPGAEPSAVASERLTLRGDLKVLDNLLQELEKKLSARAAFSDEELKVIEQVLADLKNRLEKTGK